MAEEDREDVFSINIDARLEGVGKENRVGSLGSVQNRVKITRFRSQKVISEIHEK